MADPFKPRDLTQAQRAKNIAEAKVHVAAKAAAFAEAKSAAIAKLGKGVPAPWKRDVTDRTIGPRSLRTELEANLKQFVDEFNQGTKWLSRWAASKHPRIDKTITDVNAELDVLVTRATPTVKNAYQKAQAGHEWVNQWIGGKFKELKPYASRGFVNLTDRARPLMAGAQQHTLTNASLAASWARAKYAKFEPGGKDMAFRATYMAVDSGSRFAQEADAGISKLSANYPRIGEGIGAARRGAGITRDILSPTVQGVQNSLEAAYTGAAGWAQQGYRTLQSTSLSEVPVGQIATAFKDKVAMAAAERAHRFRKTGPIARWGMLAVGMAAAGAWLWGTAQARSGPDANIPPNYIPGQQGQKVISVPWASPYQGSATDEATAYQNNIIRLSPLALPYVAQRGFAYLPRKWQENVWLATRFLEDATPFRMGRIFGLSGKFSSFITPEAGIEVPIKRLLNANRLTPYGSTFSRAMNMTQQQLVQMLNQRTGAGEEVLRFTKRAKTPFMELEGTSTALRFYASDSRFAMSFALYGAPEAQARPGLTGAGIEQRVREMIGLSPKASVKGHLITGKVSSWETRLLRFLHDKIPGGKSYIERIASIPQWDKNAVKWLQRAGLEEDLWTPGYAATRAGTRRMAGGVLFDFMRSPWGLLRSTASSFGVDIGPATRLRGMLAKASKVGLATYAGITAVSYVNETLHGALTAPLWNVYERARLFQARLSDRLGFTDIRKQHPHVYPWSAAAIVTLPWIGLEAAKFVRRATVANVHEMLGTRRRMDLGLSTQWTRGQTMPMRELPFARSAARMETKIARSSLITRKVLDPRTGKITRELTKFAKYGPLLIAGTIAKLFAPFILGTKYSEEEYADIFAGRKPVPVRKGRFWEFGNTPYEGGRISYFRMHQAARRKIDAEQKVPGSGRRSILKAIFDPYWREKESYASRPYPITQAPFEEVPFIGPILARTIGRFFKPPKLMHTQEWKAGQEYEPFGNDVAPSRELGGLRAPTPKDPLGWRSQLREGVYKATEFMGLRGFFFQSMLFEHAFGGQAPYAQAHTMQPARFKSFTKHWYDAEMGGMGGTNELFRRLFPRPQRGVEANPLQNQMPRWMPGSEYFVNFKQGDPYSKVPYGESRLPGPGFEAKYPQLEGLNPELYPSWAKFEILADVAPWAIQTRIQRAAAYKDFGNDPKLRSHLEEIDWQMEQVKRKKDFANYDFNRDMETVSGKVSEILPTGEFRLEQYPQHLFKPAGLRFGVAATSSMLRNINGMTKEKADQRAFEQQGEAQQFMADQLLGKSVKLKIPVGGMSRPDVDARIFANGVNFNRALAQKGLAAPEGEGAPTAGFAARMLGRVVEGIGHLPQKLPGPFFMFSKLYNEADPIEEYQRSELYGSSSRMWNKPWQNFIRPYLFQATAKMTPGEFVPEFTQKKRDIDMTFDRLEFLKQVQGGGTGGRTAVGMNPYGNEQQVISAMPYRERPYMQEFVKETDPRKRHQILAMVSEDMQRALTGQWTRQYAQATGQAVPTHDARGGLNATMALAQSQVQEAGYHVPGKDWVGWDKGVEIEDVKAIFLRSEGYDNHDFNIWNDRMVTLQRKPYLKGSHEYLLSRPLGLSTNILSSGSDRRRQGVSLVSEHTSRNLSSSVNVYNTSNRKGQDERAYREASDNLIAF